MAWREQIIYNRESVLKYAKTWAFGRNPAFFNFDNLGGDCTNFASQCIFAGCLTMNYTPIYGWYYRDSYDRTPSWSSCKFLYEFLTTNRGAGPFAINVDEEYVEPGDIVQFARDDNNFSHSAIVVKMSNDNLFVAAHSDNAYDRPIDSYLFPKIRYIHILGANK